MTVAAYTELEAWPRRLPILFLSSAHFYQLMVAAAKWIGRIKRVIVKKIPWVGRYDHF